jgi:hypothetical protein
VGIQASVVSARLLYLEHRLKELGIEISTPGASVQRIVWMLTEQWFGLSTTEWGRALDDLDARIGVDLITDEVARRVAARKA